MGLHVAKFGGTSLASAQAFKKVKEIITADPRRCYVIPSAPGKNGVADQKVTDLLYHCHELIMQGKDYHSGFQLVRDRFTTIVAGLGLDLHIDPYLDQIYQQMAHEDQPDYAASRGEYLNGVILAAYLGYDFVDPVELICFTDDGKLDLMLTEQTVKARLANHQRAVIPGFYGAFSSGEIKTFSRGGSDITGSIIARSMRADLYENWTDVSGFFMVDPRIVPEARQINLITYSELRELAYNGANVLHEAAIYPVRQVGIPINIRNTNCPEDQGTMIVKQVTGERNCGEIVGIAGRKDFVIISIEKALMNSELGFVRKLLSILEELEISFEHLPSGIDIVSLVLLESELNDKLDQVLTMIEKRLHPDKVEVFHNIAMIATVGEAMAYKSGIAARLFNALAGQKINVRMIDQGSSEINIIVGIDNRDFEQAITAIYRSFVS